VLALKQTLLLRPLERLLASPHLLAGFVGRHEGRLYRREGKRDVLSGNPIAFVRELYRYLNLEPRPGRAASEMIWDHDARILDEAEAFYAGVAARLGTDDFARIGAALAGSKPPAGLDAERHDACKAAHAGFQLGMEVLLLIPAIARAARFDEVRINAALEPVFPDSLSDAKVRAELHKVLAPAPLASADEIVTPMGGHFYSREAPDLPPLAQEGMRFAAGQPLFVIEVMKMFNKISVPFSGTITKVLLRDADGKTVVKGQPIFKIEPDDRRVDEPADVVAARRRTMTESLVPAAPG
jgi:biotin carboxyl carrier protein